MTSCIFIDFPEIIINKLPTPVSIHRFARLAEAEAAAAAVVAATVHEQTVPFAWIELQFIYALWYQMVNCVAHSIRSPYASHLQTTYISIRCTYTFTEYETFAPLRAFDSF